MHANQRSPWRPICFRCRVRCGGKAVWSPPVRQTDFSSSSHGRILDSLCQICPELLAVPWIKISACGKQVTGSARLRSFVASCPLQNGDARGSFSPLLIPRRQGAAPWSDVRQGGSLPQLALLKVRFLRLASQEVRAIVAGILQSYMPDNRFSVSGQLPYWFQTSNAVGRVCALA